MRPHRTLQIVFVVSLVVLTAAGIVYAVEWWTMVNGGPSDYLRWIVYGAVTNVFRGSAALIDFVHRHRAVPDPEPSAPRWRPSGDCRSRNHRNRCIPQCVPHRGRVPPGNVGDARHLGVSGRRSTLPAGARSGGPQGPCAPDGIVWRAPPRREGRKR